MCSLPEYLRKILLVLPTVDGRNPANQLRLVVYPHYFCTGLGYIPGGDRRTSSLNIPSTVCLYSNKMSNFQRSSASLVASRLSRFLEVKKLRLEMAIFIMKHTVDGRSQQKTTWDAKNLSK